MASEKKLSGTALNQRLNAAGLLDDFFKAANKKDRDKMIEVLMLVEIERSQAEETSDTLLRNPAFDGF